MDFRLPARYDCPSTRKRSDVVCGGVFVRKWYTVRNIWSVLSTAGDLHLHMTASHSSL